MKSLLILGFGDYGKLIQELAEILGYDKVDFLDDAAQNAVGKLQDVEILQDGYDETIVAIGNAAVREKYIKLLKHLATLIHPSAVVSKSARIGAGTVIEPNCVVNTGAVVEQGCFVCAGAVVNHNAVVQAYSQIDCNAVVGSYGVVPQGTKVLSCQYWTQK